MHEGYEVFLKNNWVTKSSALIMRCSL